MLLAILMAAAVAAGAQTPAPASEAAPAAAPAKPKKAQSDMVCVRETAMGSNRPTKVCYPRKAPPADPGPAKMPEVDNQR